MTRFYLYVFLGIVLLGSLSGCPATQTRTTPIGTKDDALRLEDYFPLHLGSRWTYQIHSHITKSDLKFERKIIRKQGRTFFDNANGQYHYDTYGVREGLRYLLKYPLQVGNRWLSVVGVTEVERYQIVSTKRTVQVPAGTYTNCIVVSSQKKVGRQDTLESLFYFAPQIGFVKIAIALERNGQKIPQWTYELLSFQTGTASPPSTPTPPSSR